MLLNIGFAVTVVVAVVLLLVAFGVSWYNDHLASAGSVNGQTITRDTFRKQFAINAFRNDYQNRRIRTLLTAGHLRTADAQARQSILQQRNQQAATISLEQLVDGDVMAQLAQTQNVTVTTLTSTRGWPTTRPPRAAPRWMIAVAPSSPRRDGFTPRRKRPRRRRPTRRSPTCRPARTGTRWPSVSTDPPRPGRDLGFIDKDAALDQPFVDALVAAERQHAHRGDRGRRRHVPDRAGHRHPAAGGRCDLPGTDQGRRHRPADYREALRRDVLRTKLSDAVLAGYLAASPQREVSEIWQQEGQSEAATARPRPPHPLLAQRRPRRVDRGGHRPRLGQGRAGRQGHLRQAQGRSRSSTPSRARRATRRRRSRPAASCRTSRPKMPSTRPSPRRSTRRASSRASCWSPSSRRSGGM